MAVNRFAGADAWSGYWQADRLHSCIASANPEDAAEIATYWRGFAGQLAPGARVVDLATGNGVVPVHMLEAVPTLQVTAVDQAAIDPRQYVRGQPLLARITFISGVDLADVGGLEGPFDAVTSQFGVEYAGVGVAALVLAQLLGRGGRFQMLVHHPDSAVVAPAAANRAELERLLAADGILAALAEFSSGRSSVARVVAVVRAYLDAPLRRTRRISGGVVLAVEQLLALAERQPAALPSQVAGLHARLRAEHERLRQLEAAALDARALDTLVAALGRDGIRVSRNEPLEVGGDRGDPALVGWALAGNRP